MSTTASNDLSLETLQNNTKMTDILMWLFVGLVLIGVGAAASSQGGAGIAFAIGLIGAGLYAMYTRSYKPLIDPKNERKCDIRNLTKYNNVMIPSGYLNGDVAVDTMTDSYEYDILMKVIYEGYGGVYLQSNNVPSAQGGTYDAWFIPGGTKSTTTTAPVATIPAATKSKYADRLYVVKKGPLKVTPQMSPDSSGFRSPISAPNASTYNSPFASACDTECLTNTDDTPAAGCS